MFNDDYNLLKVVKISFTLHYFLVELLWREGRFGHNTQTQMHISTYLKSVIKTCWDQDKDKVWNVEL